MPRFSIVAEFVDAKSGRRRRPGEVIEASGRRVDALRAAGVIGDEVKEQKDKGSKDGASNGPETDNPAGE